MPEPEPFSPPPRDQQLLDAMRTSRGAQEEAPVEPLPSTAFNRPAQDFSIQPPGQYEGSEEEGLAKQFAMAVPRGIEGMLQGAYGFADFVTFDALPDWKQRLLGRSTHWGASLVEGIATYAIPGTIALKAFGAAQKGTGFAISMSRLARSAMAGVVVDAVITNPNDGRLSDWAKEAGVDWAVTDFLATDEDDSEAEARLKNALEGLVPGAALDGIAEGFRAIRFAVRGGDLKAATKASNKAMSSLWREEFGFDHDEEAAVNAFIDAVGLDRNKIRPATSAEGVVLAQGPSRDAITTGENGLAQGTLTRSQADEIDGTVGELVEDMLGGGAILSEAEDAAVRSAWSVIRSGPVGARGSMSEFLDLVPGEGSKATVAALKKIRAIGDKHGMFSRGDTNYQGLGTEDGARAFVRFQEDGTALIGAFQGADVTSAIHELSHVARRQLFSDTGISTRIGLEAVDVDTAAKWAGATKKGAEWKWDTAAEEKFADGFERYMRDGQAPTKELEGFFEKVAEYFRRTYKKLTGTALDLDVTPEMKRVFDKVTQRGEALKRSRTSVRATTTSPNGTASLVIRAETPIGKSEILIYSQNGELPRFSTSSLDGPEVPKSVPITGSMADRIAKATKDTKFLYRAEVDSNRIIAVAKGEKPTAAAIEAANALAWVEEGTGKLNLLEDVDVKRVGVSEAGINDLKGLRGAGVSKALAKDEDILFQSARDAADDTTFQNARVDQEPFDPQTAINVDRASSLEGKARAINDAIDGVESNIAREALPTAHAEAFSVLEELGDSLGNETPYAMIKSLTEMSVEAVARVTRRLNAAREVFASMGNRLAATIDRYHGADGGLAGATDDQLVEILRHQQDVQLAAAAIRPVQTRLAQSLGTQRIRFRGDFNDFGRRPFIPPTPGSAGAGPGGGLGRGAGPGEGAGLGSGRGPGEGAGSGAGRGPGEGSGRGPGRGPGDGSTGRGPGRGPGEGGTGRGPGQGPGDGAGRGPGGGGGVAIPDPSVSPGMTSTAVLDAHGGRKRVVKVINQWKILNDLNPGGLPPVKMQKGWLTMVPEYFINSILSGPITHAINISSGVFQTIISPLERGIGSLLTGQGRLAVQEFSEIGHFVNESMESFKLAALAMKEDRSLLIAEGGTIREGPSLKAISPAGQGVSPDSISGKILHWLGKGVNIPSRFLMTEDEFFKQLNFRSRYKRRLTEMSMTKFKEPEARAQWVHQMMTATGEEGQFFGAKELAVRGKKLAAEVGLSGKAADEYTTKYVNKMWDGEVHKAAVEARQRARQATFTEGFQTRRGELGLTKRITGFSTRDALSGMSAKLASATADHPSLRLVFPFIRTPVNILQWFNDRSTGAVSDLLGVLSSGEVQKAFTKEAAADLAGRMATGSALVGVAAYYAGMKDENGLPKLTGAGPSDPSERKVWEATGWRPYSMRVGDKYVSYRRVDPTATFFGVVADLVQEKAYSEMLNREPEWGNALMVAVTNNLVSKTYLLGAINLARAMGEPERFAGSLLESYAGAAAPASSFVHQAVNPLRGDQLMHEIRGAGEAFRSRWILSNPDNMPVRRNVLGETIERDRGAPFGDSFSPLRYVDVKDDKLSEEMVRSGASIGPPRVTANGVDWTKFKNADGTIAYDRWMELHGTVEIGGKNLRTRLEKLIKGKAYQRLPQSGVDDLDSPRVAALRRTVSRYREKARRQVMQEFPELSSAAQLILTSKALQRKGQSLEAGSTLQ